MQLKANNPDVDGNEVRKTCVNVRLKPMHPDHQVTLLVTYALPIVRQAVEQGLASSPDLQGVVEDAATQSHRGGCEETGCTGGRVSCATTVSPYGPEGVKAQ